MNGQIPSNERNQKRLAMCLALTAGYVDAYGLLVVGAYVSFMSGNSTTSGLRIGQADFRSAFPPALGILCFLAASLVGNLVVHSNLRQPRRILFGLIAALLLLALSLGARPGLQNLDIAVLSFGMGLMNPALSQVGAEAVSLTFVTGTLNRIGRHLALGLKSAPLPGSEGAWDSHFYRARVAAQLWASFFLGAVLSSVVMSFAKSLALLPALAVMVALALSPSPPSG